MRELTTRDRSYWFTEAYDRTELAVEVTVPFNHYDRVIPVGTRAKTLSGTRSNAGFNGILVSLVLADGTRVSQRSAGFIQPYEKRVTVLLDEWDRSHAPATPRGRGGWLFRHAVTNEVINRNGTYTEARKALPKGTWVLLP